MDFGIGGKNALVCGASKGLGYGCARALVREGANVLLVARGEDALRDAAERLRADSDVPAGAGVMYVPADITTSEGRRAVFEISRDFDIVVTNAGGPPVGDFREWTREDWISAIDANMLSAIELIKATVDGMASRGYGRIVNITSSAVKAPIDVLGLSNGARSGLTGWVAGASRAQSLASRNVTINNLLPGFFDTERLRRTFEAAAQRSVRPTAELVDERREMVPARRFGTADEFGAVCAFLCSRHASYIIGQNILIDGGAYPGTF